MALFWSASHSCNEIPQTSNLSGKKVVLTDDAAQEPLMLWASSERSTTQEYVE